ncbi:hypothetical protein IC608_11240 [Devosia sp. PTR5]|uniref:Uncharacterized protein n=1 Tax=Devosia oryzisoli TaxID=2774138 RepID=A0A927ITM9_9HYPH|nr:hypothetical protein [Devosia oryzisoli]MBD8066047.1 hypothetical protein [Devosia oryzisoli]
MDELLIRVLTRLLRVHDELGEESFEEAAHRALLAIALTVQCDAERKVGIPEEERTGQQVVRFPLARRRRDRPAETPDGS